MYSSPCKDDIIIQYRTFFMKMRSFYQVLLCILYSGGLLSGRSLPETNLERFTGLVDSVWIQAINDAPLCKDDSIQIIGSQTNHPVQRLVERRLLFQLNKKNRNAHTTSDSGKAEKKLNIDILNGSVAYLKSGRNGWLGKRWFLRGVQFHASVQILDGTGRLIWGKTYECRREDRVLEHDLSYIEQNGAILGLPERPDYKDFLSRIEPWLMIGSASVVIYLFYIIRS